MKKYVIDCKSGNAGSILLTDEEQAALAEQAAQWEAQASQRQKQAIIDRLAQTDHKMSRVVEDLILSLVQTGKLSLTDLPEGAVFALLDRKHLRDSLNQL